VYLSPFRFLKFEQKKKDYLAISHVFREGIKFKNKDVGAMICLYENVDQMVALLSKSLSEPHLCRLEAGLLLRNVKELWVTCLVFATVLQIRQDPTIDWGKQSVAIYELVLSLNLDGCWKQRPLLDGKAVIEALDLPRGPQIGTYLDEQVRWMLLNPNGTAEECKAHLQCVKRRLNGVDGDVHGISDGKGSKPTKSDVHFSKRIRVESMDLDE
jgi:tRNA nucleotidyltransferase (CCA-adding enzyme)